MRRAIANLVEKAKAAEAARAPGKDGLGDAVARYLFKLMAYKDEYEVARLYTDGSFLHQVESSFSRRQAAPRISSGAAAPCPPRQDHRPAAQNELRSVADAGVPRCWRS